MNDVVRREDDFQLPTLQVAADERTQRWKAKIGKIVWSLKELEIALPEDAAQQVNTLTHKVAEELNAIVREVGNYKTL